MSDVRLIGRAARGLCETRMSDDRSDRVEICIVEAVNNVIEHAYREEEGHELFVRLHFADDHLAIEIEDSGVSMPPGLLEKNWSFEFDPTDIKNLPEGGMGLSLIQGIMDTVDYRQERNANILTMTIGYDSVRSGREKGMSAT